MNIFFSGIGGVGIGPLAHIACDAGETIYGSDLERSPVSDELEARGVMVTIGQDGTAVEAAHQATPLDWFVYTAALPADHPELVRARELGIRTGKRDEFLSAFIAEKNLTLLAISGTHGKTTTTGMLVWTLKQLGLPVSYSVGTTISFGPSGHYDPASRYFVYECDEYDKNLLHFSPALSLLTSLDYDHPDTYPTEADYAETFRTYISQSSHTIAWQHDLVKIHAPSVPSIWGLADDEVMEIALPGAHNRRNATLVVKACEYLQLGEPQAVQQAVESFPGTNRRFEQLAPNLYSDYGHHPEEIEATLQLANELSSNVVLVYQPHQNWRQHFVRENYTTQFTGARKVYWLPTYLTRENPDQAILLPQDLTGNIVNKEALMYGELNDELWQTIERERADGALVLFMGAGTIDGWVRRQLATTDTI